jgi:riboflavin biosynthesis pyrimidine reductase
VRLLLPEVRELTADDLPDLYDTGDVPVLRAGFVVSVDGGIAVSGTSRGLQTPSDSAVFFALRTVADAVMAGAGTVRNEGYGPVRFSPAAREWRRTHGRSETAPLVIVSRRLDLDPSAACFAQRPLVVTCEAAPPARLAALREVAEVLVHGESDVDLPSAVADLRARSLSSVLCEGGPTLLTSLHANDLVDELCLTTTSVLVGIAPTLLAAPLPAPTPLVLRALVDGEDGGLLYRWEVVRD